MDENEVWWESFNEVWWAGFWQDFEDLKSELVMKESKTWAEADAIARVEFKLDD